MLDQSGRDRNCYGCGPCRSDSIVEHPGATLVQPLRGNIAVFQSEVHIRVRVICSQKLPDTINSPFGRPTPEAAAPEEPEAAKAVEGRDPLSLGDHDFLCRLKSSRRWWDTFARDAFVCETVRRQSRVQVVASDVRSGSSSSAQHA